jgi:hypothetical protein
MKTLVIDIKNPMPGDEVIVQYSAPNGGKTAAKHRVLPERYRAVHDEHGIATVAEKIPADTALDVVKALIEQINRTWLSESFHAKLKDDTGSLVVNCQDTVSDVTFSAEVAGNGGTSVNIMVF